jgi:hypothetical protein
MGSSLCRPRQQLVSETDNKNRSPRRGGRERLLLRRGQKPRFVPMLHLSKGSAVCVKRHAVTQAANIKGVERLAVVV